MRAAWKVDWLRENLMDNVITKEESAPDFSRGVFGVVERGSGIRGGRYSAQDSLLEGKC